MMAESSLCLLYRALTTIDPSMRQDKRLLEADQDAANGGTSGFSDNKISEMRAVREKKEEYRNASVQFLGRLKQYMSMVFKVAEQKSMEALNQTRGGGISANSTHLDPHVHEISRRELWMYSPLMLFAREIESFEWEELMRSYEHAARKPYQEEFRENIFAWKRVTRKATGDEQELLFTSQEKEHSEGIGTAARKLTVKRGKTVRNLGHRISSSEKKDGKIDPYEAFAGALENMIPLIFQEQNFVVSFFHATSLESRDFVDVVAAAPPEARSGPNLTVKQSYDPNRFMAKNVMQMMEEIYSFWAADIQNLMEWSLQTDPL